jgi:eukaryotic-like serine/threonine-protein kinase
MNSEEENDVAQAMARVTDSVEVIGRYALHAPIAKGGMAVVHLARILGPEGFSRVVAAKRLLPQYVEDEDFIAMFLDEAKIASKIHHPNVVPVIDIVYSDCEVILVQEYVHGVPLDQVAKITAQSSPIPEGIVVSIISGVLAGLHAAHEACDERGEALHIVHRDVSPHNIIITVDGVARVLDFGIAKARSSSHITREGVFKGKLSYLAPEQLGGACVTRRADIYGAGVVLWEMLANKRLFASEKMDAARIMGAVISGAIPTIRDGVGADWSRLSASRQRMIDALQPVIKRALSSDAEARYETAEEMLAAVVAVCRAAPSLEVAAWLRVAGADFLESKQQALVESEEASRHLWMERGRGPESTSRVFVSRPSVRTLTSRSPIAVSVAAAAPPRDRQRHVGIIAATVFLGIAVCALVVVLRPNIVDVDDTRGLASSASAANTADVSINPGTLPQLGVTPFRTSAMGAELGSSAPPPTASARAPMPPQTSRPAPPPRPRVVERPKAAEPRSSETKATESPNAPPLPSAISECATPYYWDGPKKVYKPNCL